MGVLAFAMSSCRALRPAPHSKATPKTKYFRPFALTLPTGIWVVAATLRRWQRRCLALWAQTAATLRQRCRRLQGRERLITARKGVLGPLVMMMAFSVSGILALLLSWQVERPLEQVHLVICLVGQVLE